MKYLIFGAGAIGTYIGGSLHKAGKDVSFIERKDAISELQNNGIALRINNEVYTTHDVKFFDSAESALLEYKDVIIFAMKSFDTQAAAKILATHKTDFGSILCLQNGVENEEVIANDVGWKKVIGGTVTSAIGRVGFGNVVLERKRGIGLLYKGDISGKIFEDFHQADLNPVLFNSLPNMKWSKMLSNLLGNASCAILDMSPAEVFSNLPL